MNEPSRKRPCGVNMHGEESTQTHPLLNMRRIRGWSQESLAARIRVAAKKRGINLATTKKTVARWEHGVVPDHESQEVIAGVLEIPEHIVHVSPWPEWLGRSESEFSLSEESSPDRLLQKGIDGIYLDNRTRPFLIGSALLFPIYKFLNSEGLIVTAGRGRALIGHETVDRLETITNSLRDLGDQIGGGAIRGVVREQLNVCASMIKSTSHDTAIAKRLLGLTGSLSQLAGFNEVDMGRHAAAQKLYISALQCARAAGDKNLVSYTLSWIIYQCYASGNPRDGVEIAEIATSPWLNGAPMGNRALVLARGALAHAAYGDARGCTKMLNLAELMHDKAEKSDDLGLSGWFTSGEFTGTVGRSMLELGDHADAVSYLGQILDPRENPLTPRSQVVYQVRIAQALARQGDVAAACHHGGLALDLSLAMKSDRNTSLIFDLCTEVQASRSRDSQDFAELVRNSFQGSSD